MTLVYRAMKRGSDSRPLVNHTSSSGLGVRPGVDIPVNEEGNVEPGTEGMSVSPDSPRNLSTGRRPSRFGGHGKFPAWELDTELLPDSLTYAPDTAKHGFLEPAYTMEIGDYQDALEATGDLWRELS